MTASDPFDAIRDVAFGDDTYRVADPILRQVDREAVTEPDVREAASWTPDVEDVDIPFAPSRVVLQDLTGVPAVVDLAALRSAVERKGADPSIVEPEIPCNLVIDHSVQVDYFGDEEAYQRNVELEYERNAERYRALKWAQNAFEKFRVVPPGTGIVHQVTLEHLGQVGHDREEDGHRWLLP